MDITKYLKNKEIELSSDDIDFEKLERDIRKGYTKTSEVNSKIEEATKGTVLKADYDKLQEDYTKLENNYNDTVKRLDDTNTKMGRVSLESKLVRKGFKDADFDKVIKIRQSVYADEKDDAKAIDMLAEDFKATYFPEAKPTYNTAPNETKLDTTPQNKPTHDIKINRNTSIKDLLIKK